MSITFGSLFSGIGGIDLGLERAGMRCEWQVELNAYATKVLAKHWPDVARYGDIRTVGSHNLAAVDLIAGGFPCQDISTAGRQAGIEGSRSGLWSEFYRVVCELRPRFVLVENVANLLNRGIERVLGDLAACGYDAEWQCIPAVTVGAPHRRDRVFIVAYADGLRRNDGSDYRQRGCVQRDGQWDSKAIHQDRQELQPEPGKICEIMADATSQGCAIRGLQGGAETSGEIQFNEPLDCCQVLADPDRQGLAVGQVFGRNAQQELAAFKRDCSTGTGQWAVEPDVVRVADGVSSRVDRLRGLGNAVVPQVAEYVGRCILNALQAERQVGVC